MLIINNRVNWFIKNQHMKELPVFENRDQKSSYFNLVTINNIEDVVKYLDPIFNEESSRWAFRGVNNASYRMFSSIQRRWYWDGLQEFYKDMQSYIMHQITKVRKSKFISKNLCHDNDYNILAMIQHYGGSSNLIDFSYSPNSAFYFAWEGFDNHIPMDGTLKDYVSLYMVNYKHPDFAGPLEVHNNASKDIERLVKGSNIPPEKIDASIVLENLEKIPYNKIYDCTIIEGGSHGNIHMNIPCFNFEKSVQVSNSNITAQNGCFIQASSDERPLEQLIYEKSVSHHFFNCFDIHKTLVDIICKRYNIQTNRGLIYPQEYALRVLYKNIKQLDKHVFREWLFNKCNKFEFKISE